MGLSKKRKQQLSYITARSLESRKQRKVDNENQREKEFLRRLREEEDYWDEYEDNLESCFDESDDNESSPDESSSDEEGGVIEENRKEEGVHEGLGDNEGGVQVEIKERTFEPEWKSDADDYLRGVRGSGSSRTNRREKQRKKELEKSASHSRSIVDMFSAQHERNKLHHSVPHSDSAMFPKKSTDKVVKKLETKSELQGRAVHDLGELLRLKTQ